MQRWLALDGGDRTIGVARSDAPGPTAPLRLQGFLASRRALPTDPAHRGDAAP